MSVISPPDILRQHLIDPEICIRCNTCEETCPIDAITHDERNYVVDAGVCNGCMACIAPCPTGAIDNWRMVARTAAWSPTEQLAWDVLPAEPPRGAGAGDVLAGIASEPVADLAPAPFAVPAAAPPAEARRAAVGPSDSPAVLAMVDRAPGAMRPPATASQPYVNLFTPRAPLLATVTGNVRVTDSDTASDTHHVVLDFGATPFPVLEGQSIGVIPPGTDAAGRPHFARQYSIASPRDGERPGYNNLALTVKRVTADYDGRPMRGVCSNYLCDLAKGDSVQVVGPFGNTFLMPNDASAHLLMICTGTGSAPMRAMTERRRRGNVAGAGRLMLFFGARTARELPYFGPLMSLPAGFMDINFAYSRTPGATKRYVQDVMRDRAAAVASLLREPCTYIYVCGLKGMEAGVLDALRDVAQAEGLDWTSLWPRLKSEGRLHFETY